jgi:hypothetical protein
MTETVMTGKPMAENVVIGHKYFLDWLRAFAFGLKRRE